MKKKTAFLSAAAAIMMATPAMALGGYVDASYQRTDFLGAFDIDTYSVGGSFSAGPNFQFDGRYAALDAVGNADAVNLGAHVFKRGDDAVAAEAGRRAACRRHRSNSLSNPSGPGTWGMASAWSKPSSATWKDALLLGMTVWCFCRFYYFAFYVIEKYVDPAYRFSGLWSFARYLCQSRKK